MPYTCSTSLCRPRLQFMAGLLFTVTAASSAQASLIPICSGSTSCASSVVGGVPIMTTNSALPSYTVTRNPDLEPTLPPPGTLPSGDIPIYGFTPVVLVPNNFPNAASLQFTVEVRLNNNLIASASLLNSIQATPWTNSAPDLLTDYLGYTQLGGTATKLNDLLPATQAVDVGATGYYAYVDPIAVPTAFGTGNNDVVTYTGFGGFPAGTVLFPFYEYFDANSGYPPAWVVDNTAPANTIMVVSSVPEPASSILVVTGLFLLSWFRRKSRGQAAG